MAQIESNRHESSVSFSPSTDLIDSNRYSLYGSGLSTGLPAEYILMENPQIDALYEG